MNNFIHLSKVLEQILKNYGLELKLKESEALNIWNDIAGKKISRITEPLKIQDGRLFIRVSSPSWRNELVLLKPKIIEKMNERIGSKIIKEIIFV